MSSSPLLAAELEVFRNHHAEWLRNHAGTYVAIQGEQVEGFFESYADAFKAGLARFGAQQNFLITQVWQAEPVYFVF